ncbi:cyclic nucleotide-binding/CBS domain-containing protein [Halobacteriales archaeon Cl-PHB]
MADETPVSEIMSSPVVTVGADASVREAAATLAAEHVGSLVVGEDVVDGIVTETDVVAAVGDGVDLEATTVADIASDPVVTARPTVSVDDAGERMGHNDVKKLPVTEQGVPVGIVTTTDLARLFPDRQVRHAKDTEPDVEEGEFD